MSHPEGERGRVWSLINEIKVAMVVTHDGHGDRLRARPMAARPAPEENAIFFLTDASAGKDSEVDRNGNVCLAFADIKAQKYVSVSGSAEISNDRDRIRRFWSVGDRAFWKSADDPAIRLLKMIPTIAEYWEGPGLAVSIVRMIGAALSGGAPELTENKKVALSGTRSS